MAWRGEHVQAWRDALGLVIAPLRHVERLADLSNGERLEVWSALSELEEDAEAAVSTTSLSVTVERAGHVALRVSCPASVTLTDGLQNPLEPHLLSDIDDADEIDMAVAFAWESGVARVFSRLEDCLDRGGRIRILVGDYADASEPRALRKLRDLTGPDVAAQLRIFEAGRAKTSFHPKAYLLSSARCGATAYVGSSNLSAQALTTGIEWNLRITDGSGVRAAQASFETLFSHPATQPLTDAWIDAYARRRALARPRPTLGVPDPEPAPPAFAPHEIQREALDALAQTREAGNRAGLVVLATGLGKTWLSAFDSERFARVLFVAHREEILHQARDTFRAVRRDDRLGLFIGPEKEHDANVLFASVQTLSKTDNLACFPPEHFDYVVIDEFHHASARTYRQIIRHFEPRFLLGLTATPERSDGGDLLALCDENLVYRCDLGDGIARSRLCPFRYFGVPDATDYAQIPWRSSRFDEEALTQAVATKDRADNALEHWRDKGGLRTLGFCVSRRHADFMRQHFTKAGVRCAAVHSGPTSDGRTQALSRLENAEIDVLFAVDMFNEGLDVRSIDTVLMLRPTESRVLWLQQIGRGLRKSDGKPHLTIIDYIGNHRVFLNKAAGLLAVLGLEASGREVLRLLRAQQYDLPPGCEVTYDLEALEILERLFPKTRPAEALEAWYVDDREQNGVRPSALRTYHSGYNPLTTRRTHGSWLRFVTAMGDLSVPQRGAVDAQPELLDALATKPMPNAEPLVALEALLSLGAIHGRVSTSALLAACQRITERSAVLRAEVEPSEAMLRRVSKQWPWCHLEQAQVELRLGPGLEDASVYEELLSELLSWRLARYIDDRKGKVTFKVLRNSSGKAILKIDRQRYDLPTGWADLDIDNRPYRANFMKEFVNVVRSESSEENQLDALLKTWFGPDAGKRGTTFSVVHEAEPNGRYRWMPAFYGDPKTGVPVRDDRGEPLDARFNVEELDDRSVTLVFMSRNKGRNDAYNAGLERILACLAQQGWPIERIAVESGATTQMSLDDRTLHLKDVPYPLDVASVSDRLALRRQIGRSMAQLGRRPGAKGGGNMNKRIRIWVQGPKAERLRDVIGRTP